MRCNSLLHPSQRLERATNEDIRLLVLAFPPTQNGSKSFPILVLFVFVPLPLFELCFILRFPSKLSKGALKGADCIYIMIAKNLEAVSLAKKCFEVPQSIITTADSVPPCRYYSSCQARVIRFRKVDFTLRRLQSCDAVHCGRLWVHYHTKIQADYQERDFLRSREFIFLHEFRY